MTVAYDQRTLPLARGSIPAASGVTLAWDFTGVGTLPEAEPFLYGGASPPSLTVTGSHVEVTYNGIPGIRVTNGPCRYDNTTFTGQGMQVGTGDFQVAVLLTTGPTLPTTNNSVSALVIRNDAATALVSFVITESIDTGWFLNANASTGEGAGAAATYYGTNKTIVLWFRRRAGVTNVWTQEATPSSVLVERHAANSNSTDWNDTSAKRIYLAWNSNTSAYVDVAFHGVRFWGGSSLDDVTTRNVGRDFFALEANTVPVDSLSITFPTTGGSVPTSTLVSGTYTGTAPLGVEVQHGTEAWAGLSGLVAEEGVWEGSATLVEAPSAPLRARYSENPDVVSSDVTDITVGADFIGFITPAVDGDAVILRARNFRMFQRDGSDQAVGVRVIGEYSGSPTTIEWRYNGGSWATLDAAPTGGTFDEAVTLQGPAQGALEVRFSNDVAVSSALSYVGVGDVFIAAGQSNALGWSTSYLQPVPPAANPGWKAVVFDLTHVWRENEETPGAPFSGTGDAVYAAFFTRESGSYYGHLATLAMNAGVPIAVVPAARGSVGIDLWEPSSPGNTATLYGALLATAQLVGQSRSVLWWQGEGSMSDSATGTDIDPTLYADLHTALRAAFAAAGQTAQWVLTMPCVANPTATANGAIFRAALAGLATADHVGGVLDLDDPTPAYSALHYDGSGQMTDIAERMAALLGYLVPGAELTGSATTASTATGQIQTRLDLQGSAIVSALATGNLHAVLPLTGTAQVSSVGSASLSQGIHLLGAAVSSSAAEGSAAIALSLSGEAAAGSSASGAVSVMLPLTGVATTLSLASGNLQVQSQGGGSATAGSSATGQISVGVPLTGAAQALSEASASLMLTTLLSGEAVAASLASAGISLSTLLQGSAEATSSASGGISVGTPGGGVATAGSSASGVLTVRLSLTGSALAVVEAVGLISVAGRVSLVGEATAGSSATGVIKAGPSVSLSGGAVVTSVGAGVIEVSIPLEGSALALSVATGQALAMRVTLAGSAVASSSASGYFGSTPITAIDPRWYRRLARRFDVIDVASRRVGQ